MSQLAPISRILCPIDFSRTSRWTLIYACKLAKDHRASLTVLHVYPMPVGLTDQVIATPSKESRKSYVEWARDSARAQLDEFLRPLTSFTEGVELLTIVEGGDAAEVIADSAATRHVDLVAIGARGGSSLALSRLALGSVVQKAIRLVQCPVLLVKPTEEP